MPMQHDPLNLGYFEMFIASQHPRTGFAKAVVGG
jgi:hypothetical protein